MSKSTGEPNPYDALAPYYDAWQDQLRDPEVWGELALRVYDEIAGLPEDGEGNPTGDPLRILDFACGSGSVGETLAWRGHWVVGTDLSEKMIEIAEDKHATTERLSFVQGDITAMDERALSPAQLFGQPELGERFDLVMAYLETFNHFLDDGSLKTVFEALKERMEPGALLVFDVLREDYMRDVLPDLSFGERFDGELLVDAPDAEVFLFWENRSYEDPLRNVAHLTFLERIDSPSGELSREELFRAVRREVTERYVSDQSLRVIMKEAGLELLGEIDPTVLLPYDDDPFYAEDRHFFVARRPVAETD